jgi:very-short-patch-repair endonuclease
VGSSRLHLVRKGVFAVGHPRLTPPARLLAAALSYGNEATIGFRSATAHWALLADPGRGARIDVISMASHRRPGTNRHRIYVAPEQRTTRDGVPVTTVGRTLADLATVAPQPLLAKAVNEAQVRRLLTTSEIRRAADASANRPAGATLRALLSKIDPTQLVRSELERRFLALLNDTNMPPPRVNALVEIEQVLHEVDFSWPDRRLAFEIDGVGVHGTPLRHEADLERDARFTRAGWRVQRFSDVQVSEAPASVILTLTALLA